MYGLRGVRVGEASNPGPRTLFFRRRRHDLDGVSGTVVDPTSTMVDSVPETHVMTDSDGSESGASSGFLNMFARDLDVGGQGPILHDSQENLGEEHTGDDSASSRDGASEVEDDSISAHESQTIHEAPTPTAPIGTQFLRIGFESMDLINMLDIWKIRGKLMKSVPKFMQGVYRCAMRHALDVVIVGESQGDVLAQTRAWKLFFLMRMFLFRPSRGGQVSKKVLMARADLFNSGRWDELVEMSVTSSLDAARAQARRRRGASEDNVEKRARRAFHMIQLGEVSAGRQALEGASLATGDERTLNALKDPARRPPLPRDPVPHDLAQFEPGECFSLDQELFLKNVRTARKGAAPGPSGMTADHLRHLVEHVAVAAALSQAAFLLAQNKVPEEVVDAIRCGRLTALRKAVCGASSWVTFSGGLLPGRLPSKLSTRLRRPL